MQRFQGKALVGFGNLTALGNAAGDQR